MRIKTLLLKTGFTLVELLAVIAIIALLASFLMPGLAKALQRAKQGHCKASLKQLMTGIESYGADNAGYWPPERAYDPVTKKYGNPWYRPADANKQAKIKGSTATQGLFQYMMGRTAGGWQINEEVWPKGISRNGHIFGTPFQCVGSWYETSSSNGYHHGYAMNRVLATQAEYSNKDESDGKDDPRFLPKKIELVQTPSDAVVFSDGRGPGFGRGSGKPNENGVGGNVYRTRLRHINRVNVSFVDGHVISMDPLDFPRNDDKNTEGNEANTDKFDFFYFWRGFDHRRNP